MSFPGARLRRAFLGLCVAVLEIGLALAAPGETYPGRHWEKAPTPEAVGFSAARLDSLGPFLRSLGTTAMVVIARGRIAYEYGDLAKVSYIASCRKSVLAMLYGNYVASGRIRLNESLRELQIDDLGGLEPRELDATVEDLITSRSGVYHEASNRGDDHAHAPPRGSEKPGSYFLYNN
jgi:CubicO group peptidase (beta-lactamase class C family)